MEAITTENLESHLAGFAPAQVRVVLVEPSHPGNVGAVARAMANMGVKDLYLVGGVSPTMPEAMSRAASAAEILTAATVTTDLTTALAGTTLSFGTTARDRKRSLEPTILPKLPELLEKLPAGHKVALVFGRERTGMTNEELQLCTDFITIPTYSEYHSLNLSQAVMVCLYQCALSFGVQPKGERLTQEIPNFEEVTGLKGHLFKVLEEISFFKSNEQSKSMKLSFADLLSRAKLERRDIQMVRGVLRRIQVTIERLQKEKKS